MELTIPGQVLQEHFEARAKHYEAFVTHYHAQAEVIDSDESLAQNVRRRGDEHARKAAYFRLLAQYVDCNRFHQINLYDVDRLELGDMGI